MILRGLRHPAAQHVVIAAAIALLLPSLAAGFFSDDYAMLTVLGHREKVFAPWWDLYRFTPNDQATLVAFRELGVFPWWTVPSFHLHLVRPLGGALIALDYALFGASPVAWHAHSLLWFAAFLFTVRALLRRLLPAETATLALFLLAMSDAVAMPATWASARHGFVATVPALLGLLALVRARTEGWAPGKWLAPLGLAIGLAGSETALGVVAFALAFDLFGPVASTSSTWRDRARRAAPVIAVAVTYLALYAAIGGGAKDSGGYVEPFGAPVAFARAAATRVPALLGDAFLRVPAEIVPAGFTTVAMIVGAVGSALVALLWRSVEPRASDAERAAVRWTVVGAMGALLSGAGGFPGARLLVVADVGFAILLATILRYGFAAGSLAWLRRAGAGLLALVHVILAPLANLGGMKNLEAMARATERVADDGAKGANGASRVFLVAASDPMVSIYAHFVLLSRDGGAPTCWSWLDGAKADARVTRLSPTAFAVEPVGATFLRGAFESLYRAPHLPLHEGDEARQCGATIRVAAVRDGLPARIDVDLGAPPEGARDVAILAWQAGELRPLALPAVGASVVVPWSAGPMGLF